MGHYFLDIQYILCPRSSNPYIKWVTTSWTHSRIQYSQKNCAKKEKKRLMRNKHIKMNCVRKNSRIFHIECYFWRVHLIDLLLKYSFVQSINITMNLDFFKSFCIATLHVVEFLSCNLFRTGESPDCSTFRRTLWYAETAALIRNLTGHW